MILYLRTYEKGDIYKVLPSELDASMLQYLKEDALMNYIAFTGLNEKNEVIACAGLSECWEGVYEAWIALDDNHKRNYQEITPILKTLRHSLDHMPEGVQRIHANIHQDTENQEHLMTFLGFEKEAYLKNFFPYKKDCVLWRRLY